VKERMVLVIDIKHIIGTRITRGSHEVNSTIAPSINGCRCDSPQIIMSLTSVPYKRKRRSKKNAPLHEDDDDAVDTVTHVEVEVNTKHGPKTKRIKVPLTAVEEQGQSNSGIQDNPNVAPEWDMQEPPQVAAEPTRPRIGMVSF
jgi:hypothetical protein